MNKCLLNSAKMCIVLGFLYLAFPPKAYAYLDPGTGSYLLQLIIGSILMVLAAVKVYWKQVNFFLSNLFKAIWKLIIRKKTS